MNKLTMDFETRSEANLKVVGAWLYSRHPSTDVLCIAWDNGQWRMDEGLPYDLFCDVREADIIEAHNSFFEYCIWLNVCVKRYGWKPEIPLDKWRCSASKAAAMSIPRGLGDAGRSMGLAVTKDEGEGKWSMNKLSKPRKPTKNDDRVWHDDSVDWDKMLAYNRTDVESEVALSDSLPDLSETELEVWRCSERMNIRGFHVDVQGVRNAVKLAGEYARRLTAEFHQLTGLDSAGQRAKFTVWLASRGVNIPDTTAGTLDHILSFESGKPDVRRAIEIVRTLGRSSIKKYRAMLEMADVDQRVRGCFMYHGAGTGRWAGKGVQPQNFPRAYVMGQDEAWDMIHEGDLDVINLIADPLQFLSGALRGAICAPDGKKLNCADYAQIEVRVLFWLAGEMGGLDVFRSGEDMYVKMASMIYNRKVTKADTLERFLGKQATLALGFGAGFVKFLVHCRALGAPAFTMTQIRALVPPAEYASSYQWIAMDAWDRVVGLIPDATERDIPELVLTLHIVNKYRALYQNTVVALWGALQSAVCSAMRQPGQTFSVRNMAYWVEDKFLKCRLPSGRIMSYREPEMRGKDLTYMNMEDGQWRRVKTYGGKLAENATQATARDFMAAAMLRLAGTPYEDITMTVHDELVVELDENEGSLEEFLALVSEPPSWAQDLPVKAEGWSGGRYRK